MPKLAQEKGVHPGPTGGYGQKEEETSTLICNTQEEAPKLLHLFCGKVR